MSDIKFLDGIIVKRPREGSPDFVKCKLSFKVDEAIETLKKYEKNGWVNADLKVSKGGKLYLSLDEFEPKKQEINTDNLNF